jgi:hypothetical protein
MKKRFGLALILAGVLGMFSHASALSDPWWLAYNELIYSIGLDSRLQIAEPVEDNSSHTITIRATTENYFGAALKLLLREQIDGTNIDVVDTSGSEIVIPPITITPEVIKSAMDIVFESNQYVHSVELKASLPGLPSTVHLITEMANIQFYTDDISQYYGRSTYTAQELFSMIIKDSIEDTYIYSNTRLYISPCPGL